MKRIITMAALIPLVMCISGQGARASIKNPNLKEYYHLGGYFLVMFYLIYHLTLHKSVLIIY